jgi:hypothetical protein
MSIPDTQVQWLLFGNRIFNWVPVITFYVVIFLFKLHALPKTYHRLRIQVQVIKGATLCPMSEINSHHVGSTAYTKLTSTEVG